jgi:hypothetical protein
MERKQPSFPPTFLNQRTMVVPSNSYAYRAKTSIGRTSVEYDEYKRKDYKSISHLLPHVGLIFIYLFFIIIIF